MFSERVSTYIKDTVEDKINLEYIALYKKLYKVDFKEDLKSYDRLRVNGIGEGLVDISPLKPLSNIFGNRVLLKVTNACFAHCRYCFRRDDIGENDAKISFSELDDAYKSIAINSEIKEVVVSGGEPFTLTDEKIFYIVENLFKLENIRRIRFDTSIFTHNPNRISQKLVDKLTTIKNHYKKQIIIVGHFTHSAEITPSLIRAVEKFSNNGIMVRSHTPLLKGVNNKEGVLVELFGMLVDIGVHPYYLIHYIAHERTKHFELSLSEGLKLYDEILHKCTGIEIPSYILYLKEGRGKKRLLSHNIIDNNDGTYEVLDKNGEKYIHKDFDI